MCTKLYKCMKIVVILQAKGSRHEYAAIFMIYDASGGYLNYDSVDFTAIQVAYECENDESK